MVGKTLGHYQILEKIGEGGMGAVYRARDLRLDRFVALKILPEQTNADPEPAAHHARRFLHEAKSASALNHPNIITIYETGSEEGIDFIAMEYVRGRTLRAVIGRNGLPVPLVLQYATQIAGALATAHAAGILHRDLKPSNVMVTEAGLVKVLDFGLAKRAVVREDEETESLTSEIGAIAGTAAYMSPEQAEGKRLDLRSDIFAFGTVLYEMISGSRPFSGDSHAATLAAVLRAEAQPLSAFRRDIPADLERLVERCLRKDPARRIQTMADLKVDLEDLLEESKTGRVAALSPTPRGHLPRWIIAVATVAILSGAAAYWLIHGPRNPLQPLAPLSALPLTGNQGLEDQPAFSPDGNQVAYTWNGPTEDNFDIYVKLIGPGAPLRLTTNPAPDLLPAWSPDGRWIAFLRQYSDERFDILLIPALGGSERKIGETLMRIGGHLAWTPDSQHLLVAGRTEPQEPNGISIISISTGERQTLTVPPLATIGGDGHPALSPDGHIMAFIRGPSGASLEIYTVPLSPEFRPLGPARQITFENRRSLWPAWSPDGRDLIYTSQVKGQDALWRVRADGSGKPERLAAVGEGGINLAISSGSHRMVYARRSMDENIWRLPIVNGKAGQPVRLIASTLRDIEPHFSPDGGKISFTSDRSGHHEVWIADADGSNQIQLTDRKTSMTGGARWSPDGRRLVFLSTVNDQQEIFVMPSGGGAMTRLTNHPAHDTAPSWSRDGNWIYFGSNRGGEFQIWKMPSTGGDPVQLTHKGGYAALESCDGKDVYYARRRATDGIWRVPAAGGEETQVIPGIDLWGNFAVTEKGIYFVPAEKGTIQFYDFATRRVHIIAKINKPLQFGLNATDDGQSVIYTQMDRQMDELMLVDNFR